MVTIMINNKNSKNIIRKIVLLILIGIFFIGYLSETALAAELFESEQNNTQAEIKVQSDETIKVSTDEKTWLFPRQVVGQPTGGREKHVYPSLDQVSAANYIVMDLETEEVLLEHNVDEIAYPASMTKIMTALTVIESPDFDLQRPVVFSEYAVDLPSPLSASAGFIAGEETTTENALYLMMVQSANECARALAETYGGTEENFANLMNELALEIGCKNTNLVDAAGFGLEDHFFTPRDLALIIKRAMSHDIFRKLVTRRAYCSEPTNIHPYTAWTMVTNSNHLMLQGDLNLSSEYLHTYDGVKTGNTDIAGNCLSATVHTYDGRHLCGIIFNGSLAERPGEFFSVSVLLRTLLEEAAKQSEAPTEAEAYQFLSDNPDIANEVSGYQNLCHISELYKEGQLSEEQIAALIDNVDQDQPDDPGSVDKTKQQAKTEVEEEKTLTEASASEESTSKSESDNSLMNLLSEDNMQYVLLVMWALLFIVIVILLIQLIIKSRKKRIRKNK